MRLNLKLLFPVATLCLFGPSSRALEISPEAFGFCGKKNQILKAEMSLLNGSPSPVAVRIDVSSDGSPKEKGWLRVVPASLRIGPGQRRVVKLRIRVPDSRGERNGEIRVRAPGPIDGSEIRWVRNVQVQIAGTERYALLVDSIRAEVGGDRVALEVAYRNDGNVTLRPKFGADLVLAGGGRAAAFQEGMEAPVAPGARGNARVVVRVGGSGWEGKGTVTGYYRDAAGETRKTEKGIGN